MNFVLLKMIVVGFFTTLWTSVVILLSSRKMPEARYATTRKVVLWGKRMCAQAGIAIKVEFTGQIALTKGRPYMLMVNHRSFYDIPLSFYGFKFWDVRMIAKSELFKVPIWADAMRASEFISIDRTDAQSAMESLEKARLQMIDGVIPWIAPEGTRSDSTEMLAFKPGGFKMAMDADAIIIPAVLMGAGEIMPKKSLKIQYGHDITIRIGEPVDTHGLKKFERKKLMAEVRASMEALQQSESMAYQFGSPEEAAGFVKGNQAKQNVAQNSSQ